jgi:Tol biopolymer transport system component
MKYFLGWLILACTGMVVIAVYILRQEPYPGNDEQVPKIGSRIVPFLPVAVSLKPSILFEDIGKLSPDWKKVAWKPGSESLCVVDLQYGGKSFIAARAYGYGHWNHKGTKIAYLGTARLDTAPVPQFCVADASGASKIILWRESRPSPTLAWWSPDDSKILINPGFSNVYHIVPADGSEPPKPLSLMTLLSRTPLSRVTRLWALKSEFLAWTPASDGLIFTAYEPAEISRLRNGKIYGEICELDLKGEIRNVLFQFPPTGPITNLTLSPDLQKLAFARVFSHGPVADFLCLSVMSMDRSDWIEIKIGNPDRHEIREICWSPDSKRIAFLLEEATWAEGKGEYVTTKSICVVNSDGSGQKIINNIKPQAPQEGGIYTALCGWSPDGRKLAYFSEARSVTHEKVYQIYTIEIDH